MFPNKKKANTTMVEDEKSLDKRFTMQRRSSNGFYEANQ